MGRPSDSDGALSLPPVDLLKHALRRWTDGNLRIAIVARAADQCRVEILGEIDMLTIQTLQAALAEILETTPPGSTLILDTSGVSFLSVSGIRAFLQADEQLRARASVLIVDPVSPAVEMMLRVVGGEWLLDAAS